MQNSKITESTKQTCMNITVINAGWDTPFEIFWGIAKRYSPGNLTL